MSPDHYSIDDRLTVKSERIDLGLNIPENFDIQTVLTVDRLLRLHPNWFISNLVQENDHFTADIKDYSTDKESTLTGHVLINKQDQQVLRICLNGTIDIDIQFYNINGALAVQTHSCEPIEAVDPVLQWIRAILQYLRLYVKKTPITLFFRLLMNRMILQMNPSQRKISMMIAKITMVEVLVILLIVVGYVIFVL